MDDDPYTAMHAAADSVERKLHPFLTRAVLDAFDCDDILRAGQEWLDEDDPDVEKLRQAFDAFHQR